MNVETVDCRLIYKLESQREGWMSALAFFLLLARQKIVLVGSCFEGMSTSEVVRLCCRGVSCLR